MVKGLLTLFSCLLLVHRYIRIQQMKVYYMFSYFNFTRTKLMTIIQMYIYISLSFQTPRKLEFFFAPQKKTRQKDLLSRTCAWRKPKIWRFQKWLSLVSRPKKKSRSEEKRHEWWGFGWWMYSFVVVFVQQTFGSVRFHVWSVGKPALFVSSGFLLHTEPHENKLPEAWMDFFFSKPPVFEVLSGTDPVM